MNKILDVKRLVDYASSRGLDAAEEFLMGVGV
jgi:hypothetical protein